MHYSEIIISELVKLGWIFNGDNLLTKVFTIDPSLVGLTGVRTRIITIEACERSRYMSVVRGFDVVFDIDGREYIGREIEAAKILNDKANSIYPSKG